jgi:hypothetical protein
VSGDFDKKGAVVRPSESDLPTGWSRLLDAEWAQRCDRAGVADRSGEVLRSLNRSRDSTRAAVVLGDHNAFVVLRGQVDRLRLGHVTVEQAVWKEHHVRGETITTDMAALPRPVGIGSGEGCSGWTTAYGAACVVPPMRADEIHRFATRLTINSAGQHVQQQFVRR